MPASFLGLPAELRNEIYRYLLVPGEPIDPWNGDHGLVPNLLFANSIILFEARPFLYGHNYFYLTTGKSKQISRFFDGIGHINASHLQYIRIDFPQLRDVDDEVRLGEGSLRILEKIQSCCPNLRRLVTTPDSTLFMESRLDSFDSPRICARAFALVGAHFRAVSSLQEIIIEVYEEGRSSDIRKKMESQGWIFNVVEPVEEETEKVYRRMLETY